MSGPLLQRTSNAAERGALPPRKAKGGRRFRGDRPIVFLLMR